MLGAGCVTCVLFRYRAGVSYVFLTPVFTPRGTLLLVCAESHRSQVVPCTGLCESHLYQSSYRRVLRRMGLWGEDSGPHTITHTLLTV